ncbi:TadE-like protein [Granulicella rosea]|uniref:TadE-like protein n=1 Tax=Granulicella rosea TaxID=474952 RepID=A0A239KRV7_9BACT|nr:TadE/TadG family type IV pilus assembly protein [Granulicella rosea]SNT19944.1 TadE-like protein [Granulicella rosea]
MNAILKSIRKLRDESGQAAVELAVSLPLLLLVVTGITTFGIALNNYQTLLNATSVGAQQLAISRGQTTDPCSTTSTAVYNAAQNLTHANLGFKITINGVSYTGTSCSAATTITGSAANMVQGATAQVTVTYPCSLVVYKANYAPTCSLTAQSSELIQ